MLRRLALNPYFQYSTIAAALVALAVGTLLALFPGSNAPERCLQDRYRGDALTRIARAMEDGESIYTNGPGLTCVGAGRLLRTGMHPKALDERLMAAWISDPAFRLGLYEAHVERVIPSAAGQGTTLMPILESLDTLTRDAKALKTCPVTAAGRIADYEGLEAPLISAMILRSGLARHDGDAGNVALDLDHVLTLAQTFAAYPASSCTEAPRYFTAMNAFIAGLHPLAPDCKPRLDGSDVVLDCVRSVP